MCWVENTTYICIFHSTGVQVLEENMLIIHTFAFFIWHQLPVIAVLFVELKIRCIFAFCIWLQLLVIADLCIKLMKIRYMYAFYIRRQLPVTWVYCFEWEIQYVFWHFSFGEVAILFFFFLFFKLMAHALDLHTNYKMRCTLGCFIVLLGRDAQVDRQFLRNDARIYANW